MDSFQILLVVSTNFAGTSKFLIDSIRVGFDVSDRENKRRKVKKAILR
jgi:hypothetical protein